MIMLYIIPFMSFGQDDVARADIGRRVKNYNASEYIIFYYYYDNNMRVHGIIPIRACNVHTRTIYRIGTIEYRCACARIYTTVIVI